MQLAKVIFLSSLYLLNSNLVQAETKDWLFDVFLDNNIIGFHSFKLSNNHLLSDAKFKVDFYFLRHMSINTHPMNTGKMTVLSL